MNVNFISVSCISRRKLFILVSNKSVVLLLWMISFMVTLRLWMSYYYIDDSSLIIYKKYCNAKNYPDLIMTLPFKSWMVWSCLKMLDLLTHANHASWGEMTKTSHSGKTECVMIVVYHTLWCIIFQQVVNFIISCTSCVDLDEYVYSLMKHESEIIWSDQRDFRTKTGIKLTRKIIIYDLIKMTKVLS